MAETVVDEHGPTWHAQFDRHVNPLLDKLADMVRLRSEAYAQLVLLADKYPQLNRDANFRAARLALVPTENAVRDAVKGTTP